MNDLNNVIEYKIVSIMIYIDITLIVIVMIPLLKYTIIICNTFISK